MGRYQQRKAQGVKIRNHKIERPNSTPFEVLAVNQAKQASRFRNRVSECTVEGGGKREMSLHQHGWQKGFQHVKPPGEEMRSLLQGQL